MNLKLSALILASLLLAACGDDKAAGGSGNSGSSGSSGGTEAPMDDHGTLHPLGEITIGGFKMTVTQAGEVEAGKEAAFDVGFAEGATMPETVRGWVGIESGKGSRKGKFDKMMGKLHGHVEVPDPMPEGSKLWIEVELDSGPVRGSIALELH